jgi:hypothetical protein
LFWEAWFHGHPATRPPPRPWAKLRFAQSMVPAKAKTNPATSRLFVFIANLL